jgi:hypothetical protein
MHRHHTIGATIMRVFVYFNLHRKCWSIKALDGAARGRVVAHASEVSIADATFKVSEAGRARVIDEQRKNVHAGIVGTLQDVVGSATLAGVQAGFPKALMGPLDALLPTEGVSVTYNPYQWSTFVRRDTYQPVHSAALVTLGRSVRALGRDCPSA